MLLLENPVLRLIFDRTTFFCPWRSHSSPTGLGGQSLVEENIFTKVFGGRSVTDRMTRGDGASGGPHPFDETRLMRLLGLSCDAADPVTIILAAQVRLRRLRRLVGRCEVRPERASDRIRQICDARDTLLQRAFLLKRDAHRTRVV